MSSPAVFSTGICGCFSDFPGCIYTLFCPMCANGYNWSKVLGESCGLDHCLLASIPHFLNKMK